MLKLLVQNERILNNYRILQKLAGKTPMIPVLEANAYGLGDVAIAQLLAAEGVHTIAVSRLEEAVRVAQAVHEVDILLMTPYASEEELELILENDLIAAVDSNDCAVLMSSLSRKLHRRARIQLCFDFGMGRFGYAPEEASTAAQTVNMLGNLSLAGVFTVLPSGGEKKSKLRQQQVKDFGRVLSAIEREGLDPGIAHMADVYKASFCPEMKHTAVRIGADLFGRGQMRDKHGLKKAGRATAEVCDLKWLSAGSTVGENGRCKVRKATRVAIVPVGMADGLFPKETALFKRKKTCEINGKHAPIIGQAGLTALTVDVTDIDCSNGDIVSFDVDSVGISAFAHREYV